MTNPLAGQPFDAPKNVLANLITDRTKIAGRATATRIEAWRTSAPRDGGSIARRFIRVCTG